MLSRNLEKKYVKSSACIYQACELGCFGLVKEVSGLISVAPKRDCSMEDPPFFP